MAAAARPILMTGDAANADPVLVYNAAPPPCGSRGRRAERRTESGKPVVEKPVLIFSRRAIPAPFQDAMADPCLRRRRDRGSGHAPVASPPRQIAAVRAHRDSVPDPFRGQVELAEQQKAADYTVARASLGRLDTVAEAVIRLLFTLGGGIHYIDSACTDLGLPSRGTARS